MADRTLDTTVVTHTFTPDQALKIKHTRLSYAIVMLAGGADELLAGGADERRRLVEQL